MRDGAYVARHHRLDLGFVRDAETMQSSIVNDEGDVDRLAVSKSKHPETNSAKALSAAVRSKRASRSRLLLAGQAEQVDEVLMKFEPDGVIGVAVRRGEIAMIAGLELG